MGFIKYRSGPGAEWQEIQGIKGDKGDTPVKGVDYFTETEKNEFIQEIQNSVIGEVELANYYTKTEVDTLIEGIEPEADLTDYYTKTEADAAIQEALTGTLTAEDLAGYALKTDIPSTTGLATEEYVDEAIAAIPATDLSNYYNKGQVNELVKTAKPDLTDYATKDDVQNAIEAIPGVDLSNYYIKEETYTKAEVNNLIANIEVEGGAEVDLSDYYTKTQTNAAISNQLANYYNKSQTNNVIKAIFTYNSSTGRLDIKI